MAVAKPHFLRFFVPFNWKLETPLPPTFEIYGHGASFRCHCNASYTNGWNLNTLVHQERIWLHSTGETSFFTIFRVIQFKTHAAQIFEKNSHGLIYIASVIPDKRNDGIRTMKPIKNEFDYIALAKTSFFTIFGTGHFKTGNTPIAPTFGRNGRGAYMWCHRNATHIKG